MNYNLLGNVHWLELAVQLAAESAESPEVFEATHAAAIMAMMILPIDELAKLNTDSAS